MILRFAALAFRGIVIGLERARNARKSPGPLLVPVAHFTAIIQKWPFASFNAKEANIRRGQIDNACA